MSCRGQICYVYTTREELPTSVQKARISCSSRKLLHTGVFSANLMSSSTTHVLICAAPRIPSTVLQCVYLHYPTISPSVQQQQQQPELLLSCTAPHA